MNYLQRQGIDKAARSMILAGLLLLLAACSSLGLQRAAIPVQPVPGGDPDRGALAIRAYGCGSCHTIPGVAGANSTVGPPLDDWADRHYISGKLPNQPEFLIQWVRFPEAIEPGGAMPNMGVTEQDARDITAYLFTLTRN